MKEPDTRDWSEARLQCILQILAKLWGWEYRHHRSSRRQAKGWPDHTLLRREPPKAEAFWVELKREAQKLTDKQTEILSGLRLAGHEVHVWRPSDLQAIVRRLAPHDMTEAQLTLFLAKAQVGASPFLDSKRR